MAITTKINIAIIDYKTSTGKDSVSIYLGHNQIIELRRWVDDTCYYKTETPVDRPEYGGRKVYEVDCNDHLAVA
jgi:hypothetical protein